MLAVLYGSAMVTAYFPSPEPEYSKMLQKPFKTLTSPSEALNAEPSALYSI